ncbi:hypothetical protein PC122_g2321 [Phytophthora cactorum]|nr:hypothetical protein PC122_g2321 [Phytophthora cactorum]
MQSLAIIRVFLVFFVIVGVQHAVSVEGIHLSEACSGSRGVAFSDFNSVFDLPIAVCNCLGIPVPASVKFSDTVLVIVETIVKQAITNGDQILSSATNVLALLADTRATNSTTSTTVEELQDLIDSNSTCGYQLKNLTDHVIISVNEIRNATPSIAANDIRVAILAALRLC